MILHQDTKHTFLDEGESESYDGVLYSYGSKQGQSFIYANDDKTWV